MREYLVKAGFSILILTAIAVPALAQRTTGEIIGKTVDESGAVMPGVTVTLRSTAIQGAQTVVTSETGAYRFPVLPPGIYDLEYLLTGFGTLRREGIQVALGSTVELNVTLKLSSLEETLTVTGQAPVVDVTTSQVSTSYNKDWVENAPVRRFSYFDLINSAPGVSQTTNVGTGTTATSLGSSTNENQYQIDGTVIGSDPWLSTDAIEEIEVLQLGASAEYGNVQGAVFNVVTRQGGNVLHGSGNYYFQNDALTSRNTDAAFDKGFPYHRDTWRDASIQASGPFIRDKFWFFGLYEYQRDYDSQPGVNPAFPSKSDAQRMFWKFNYSFNDKHRILNGYHDDFYWLPAVTSPFDAPGSLSQGHGHNPTPNVVYTSVLTSRTFVEARYSGKYLQSSTDPQVEGEPRIGIRYSDQDTSFVTGAITQWTENRTWQYGFSGKVSHFAEGFLGGSHDLQAGVQFNTIGNSTLTGPNDSIRTFSVTGRQSTGTTQLPYYRGTRSQTWGTYLDDTYRLGSNTTINLGVRLDYSKGYYPSFPMLDQSGNQTGQVSAPNDDVYHWLTASPRFGINFKPLEQTVIKAHYGRYYNALERDFADIVPSTTTQFTFNVDAAGNRSNFTSSRPSNFRVDPDRKNPYSDQFIVQVEQGLVENLGLQVNYVHKRGENFAGWEDIVGTYVPVSYVDNVGLEASAKTFTLYRLTSAASDRIFLLTTPSGPDGKGLYSRYNGVTFMLTKRMSNNWQGVVSVVFSEAKGRLSSSARSSPSSAQTSAAGSFGQTAAGLNDWVNTDGLLAGDKPVVAKAQIVYRFPWGVMAALNMQHQTGRLWSRTIQPPGLGFPSSVTVNMESNTGDRRVTDVNLFDLRVQKSIDFTPSVKVNLFLDALNLSNSDQNESVASQLGTATTTFGVPNRIILPRRVQLGAKFVW
jgi:hypothetical protein